MKIMRLLAFATFTLALLYLASCSDDDAPTFTFPTANINATGYTMGGTPQFLYSTDGGTTYSATIPTNISSGQTIKVKVNNGTADLNPDDFEFDWTGSSPAPVSESNGVADFLVSTDVTLALKITDKISLVTSHRGNGKFYTINTATGALTEAFTPTYDANALLSVRGFVYHYKKGLFYASQNTDAGGYLYSINPANKVATRINENNGANGAEVWDAIVNWAVASDDSLIALGDFNDDGNGVVKFGTDGGRSKKTAQADICCALGMIYNVTAGTFQIANGYDASEGEVIIQTLTNAGAFTGEPVTITTFTGFPNDLSLDYIYLRTMAKSNDGTIYGTLYDSESKKTFFVKVNISGAAITYVSTLGADNNNQYNSLAYIPNYTF
jgi:hypothetical protein